MTFLITGICLVFPFSIRNWLRLLAIPFQNVYDCCHLQTYGQLCIKLEDLWDTLHSFFNFTQSHDVDLQLLDKISDKVTKVWTSFSREKLINDAITYQLLVWTS